MFMAPSEPVKKYGLSVYVLIAGALVCLIEPPDKYGSWRVKPLRSKFPPGGKEELRAELTEEVCSPLDAGSGATPHPAMPINANNNTGDTVFGVLNMCFSN